jgi:hypothetical protein
MRRRRRRPSSLTSGLGRRDQRFPFESLVVPQSMRRAKEVRESRKASVAATEERQQHRRGQSSSSRLRLRRCTSVSRKLSRTTGDDVLCIVQFRGRKPASRWCLTAKLTLGINSTLPTTTASARGSRTSFRTYINVVTSREPSAISSNKHSARRSQPGRLFVDCAGSTPPVAPFTSKGDVMNCIG